MYTNRVHIFIYPLPQKVFGIPPPETKPFVFSIFEKEL